MVLLSVSVTVGSFGAICIITIIRNIINCYPTCDLLLWLVAVLDTPPALSAWVLIAKLAVYVATSPIARIPAAEPCVAPPKIGPLVKVKPTPLRSVIVSMIETPVKAVSCVGCNYIINRITETCDPISIISTTAVLVTVIDEVGELSVSVTVASLWLPSCLGHHHHQKYH